MKKLRKILLPGFAVSGPVLLSAAILCVVWELSPNWRAGSSLRDGGFSPLPPSAESVTHDYTGPFGPVGVLKNGFLGSVTISISFEAAQSDVADFVSNSPIISDTRTRKTAGGFEGEIDSMTSWKLRVDERGNKVRIIIRDHFD